MLAMITLSLTLVQYDHSNGILLTL